MMPLWKDEVKKDPRREIFYFDQVGNLNALRWENWKLLFGDHNNRTIYLLPTFVKFFLDGFGIKIL